MSGKESHGCSSAGLPEHLMMFHQDVHQQDSWWYLLQALDLLPQHSKLLIYAPECDGYQCHHRFQQLTVLKNHHWSRVSDESWCASTFLDPGLEK